MSLQELMAQYGPLAVFIGAGAEGETAAFLGGVFAHRHLMPWWQAAVAAAAGSFVADQLFFLAGRYAAKLAFVQRFSRQKAMRRVTGLLETYPTGFILAFRFIYGIRIISPVAIGLSKVPALRFLLLNAIAAAIWGVVITAVGYLIGNAVEGIFGRLRLHMHLMVALGVILVVVIAAALAVRYGMNRDARKQDAPPSSQP
jgi:membrane protein DedA with SNARE-associated domain